MSTPSEDCAATAAANVTTTATSASASVVYVSDDCSVSVGNDGTRSQCETTNTNTNTNNLSSNADVADFQLLIESADDEDENENDNENDTDTLGKLGHSPAALTNASKFKFNVTKLDNLTLQDSSVINNNNNNTNNNTNSSSNHHKKIYIEVQSTTAEDPRPDINHYRNLLSLSAATNGDIKSRPTLNELQNIRKWAKTGDTIMTCPNRTTTTKEEAIKFGWIKGVLIRCILNIFGVILFMRVSWIVGHAGVALSTLIILLATVVTLITALSTSAICTNGEVRGGGVYYLISRSLGPEFGGAIGIVFSFANAVAAAMYLIGFAEELVSVLDMPMIDGSLNDIRLIGFVSNVCMLVIALIGMSWEAKVQIGLLLILMASFISFIIGSLLSPSEAQLAKGFVGYNMSNLAANLAPDFRNGQDFASVFGVFFPAVTGILAGANISGNLKKPNKSIPKGTLLSIIITSCVYLIFAWICGATVAREASGEVGVECVGIVAAGNNSAVKCKYGLLNNYRVMEMVAALPVLITAGIFSASLSSALASLVSAPKIFQAVCEDNLFPSVAYFGKGRGRGNEPWRGYMLAFLISSVCIGVGDLNLIAPIISNLFLMSYALVNFSCFDASLAQAPGWRPSFKYYNKWVSLFGSLLCITVMFVINWWAALISFLAILGIYIYVKQTKPDVNWGSSTDAHTFRRSLDYSLKLNCIDEHVKNYRPNFLVLTGPPTNRSALCDLVASIARARSLMICANVLVMNDETSYSRGNDSVYAWFRKRKIKSFYSEINASSLRTGVNSLIQSVGIGKLRPNTLVIGFKNDWSTASNESVLDYYDMINEVFSFQFGICILRLEGGLDFSDLLGEELDEQNSTSESEFSDSGETKLDIFIESNDQISIGGRGDRVVVVADGEPNGDHNAKEEEVEKESDQYFPMYSKCVPARQSARDRPYSLVERKSSVSQFTKSTELIKLKNTPINQGVLQGVNIFYRKYHSGFVDVWWLYDDGGLTLLLPYLLAQKKYWKKCKLRIFIQTTGHECDIGEEQRKMVVLLAKFRIEYHDLIVVNTSGKSPKPASRALYEKLIENWRLRSNETVEQYPWKISDQMYKQNIQKINHYLVLRELLIEYSQSSAFIFVTISVPSKVSCCAGLYMSYLDLISKNMPPILMVRGNQEPVLTYYS